jgi:cyclase
MEAVIPSTRRPRIIPVLLLYGNQLRKSVRFRDPSYVGDPINALRIFNEKEADEMCLMDVLASKEGKGPNIDWIRTLASECFMPLCYGGGVTSLFQMDQLFQAGVEKISLNTASHDANLIREAAARFGSQSVVVCIDFNRNWLGRTRVVTKGKTVADDLPGWARRMEDLGIGEIVVQSVDRDGTMTGYDLPAIRDVSAAVRVPIIALGGAGSLTHLKEGIAAGASAVAAGSMFVFYGPHKAVLITYPSQRELLQ